MNLLAKRGSGKPSLLLIGMIIISIISIGLSVFLSKKAYEKSNAAAEAAYAETKEQTMNDIYQGIYDLSYENSEEQAHVLNRVAIDVSGAIELKNLEVLRVYEGEPVIEKGEDNPMGITSWEDTSATAVYTVNMSEAEYVTDNVRQSITVRIPSPEISEFNVLEMNNIFTMYAPKTESEEEEVVEEVDVSEKQRDKANSVLQDSIRNNERYEKTAKANAEKIIKELITSLNPNASELKIVVEFTD